MQGVTRAMFSINPYAVGGNQQRAEVIHGCLDSEIVCFLGLNLQQPFFVFLSNYVKDSSGYLCMKRCLKKMRFFAPPAPNGCLYVIDPVEKWYVYWAVMCTLGWLINHLCLVWTDQNGDWDIPELLLWVIAKENTSHLDWEFELQTDLIVHWPISFWVKLSLGLFLLMYISRDWWNQDTSTIVFLCHLSYRNAAYPHPTTPLK